MRIFDCMMFSNEIDQLYIRLRELDPVVEEFVLVQGTRTFQGAPRELVDPTLDSRVKEFRDRIRHVTVDRLPGVGPPWFSEYALRNAIGEALRGIVQPDDVVLASDADEIPRRAAVLEARKVAEGDVAGLAQRGLCYGLNWEHTRAWTQARAFRARALDFVSVEELRHCPPSTIIRDAGWHLSYFYRRGELVEQLERKVRAYSHQEWASREYLERRYLEFCVRGGLYWCTKPKYREKLRYRDVDASYPEVVREEPEQWEEFRLRPEDRDRGAEWRAELYNVMCLIGLFVEFRRSKVPGSGTTVV
jgi:hypothetical protein